MEERVYEPKFYQDEYLKNKSGIYQIRNLVNGKIYIGSAEEFYRRKNYEHFYLLKRNKHVNRKLQRAYNKYGKQNFIFEIIEFVEDKNKLLEHEQYWMDRYNVVKNGYNIQPKAGKICITDEIRKKMSGKTPWNKGKTGIYTKETLLRMKTNRKSIKGENNYFYGKTGASAYNAKPVICLETMCKYSTIREASKATGINENSIAGCMNKHKTNITNGVHWMSLEDYKKSTQEEIQNILSKTSNKREVICLETKEIFNSINIAKNKYKGDIRANCIKHTPTKEGLHFMFKEEYDRCNNEQIKNILKTKCNTKPNEVKVVRINDLKIYDSISETARDNNTTVKKIKFRCKNTNINLNGLYFMYYADYLKLTPEELQQKLSK